jgi:hypothetical protein
MNRNPKKIVAATIGVIEYLKAESERARQEKRAAMEAPSPLGGQQAQPTGSLWAASGRMEIMRFRNLVELRIFRRGR